MQLYLMNRKCMHAARDLLLGSPDRSLRFKISSAFWCSTSITSKGSGDALSDDNNLEHSYLFQFLTDIFY